jgi:hypothetical protein
MTMTANEKTEVEFDALCGQAFLDGVDRDTTQVRQWDDQFESAQCVRFRLDGVVYTAVENPQDGYRSSMQGLYIEPGSVMKHTFDPVLVTVREGEGSDSEVLEILCAETGKPLLKVGTVNHDDYYPSFIDDWRPENLPANLHLAAQSEAQDEALRAQHAEW